MASVNKVILIGNLGKDPETRYAPSGDAICNITLATTDSWKDRATGEKKEATEWHRVVLFGKLGEIAGEYLKKGRTVYIEGRLQTRKYQDKEGVERYSTEIVASDMQMLGGGEGRSEGGRGGEPVWGGDRPQRSAPAQRREPAQAPAKPAFDDVPFDDDIPF